MDGIYYMVESSNFETVIVRDAEVLLDLKVFFSQWHGINLEDIVIKRVKVTVIEEEK